MMMSRFLPVFGIVLLLGTVCWRTWWQLRRHGAAGIWFLRSERWQEKTRDALAIVLILVLAGQAVTAAAWPDLLASRYVIAPPGTPIWPVIGAALLFGGVALLVVAQLNLGASWRIGIDKEARPGLVTSGLYRFCRNPIFSAILSMLVGYTLLLPTRLSLILLVSAFIGIRLQVLSEEAYLANAYGDAYRAYSRRVGRFLPRVGRLR
jgi:protein-S-isoprenylcysteine O-methyltransferase Ste14